MIFTFSLKTSPLVPANCYIKGIGILLPAMRMISTIM